MAACYTHALSSTKKWGGEIGDYLPIHLWFDDPKNHIGDFRQRALRHHTLGVAECLTLFGEALTLSTGRVIPTRWVCEQHLIEDFGRAGNDHARHERRRTWPLTMTGGLARTTAATVRPYGR